MKKSIKKYPPIPKEKLEKYQDLWKNSTSRDGVHPDLKAHFERVKTMGDGKGIEFLSNLNKDYLGAFMAPFSQNVEDADIVVIGMPFEKSAPMNASHKYGQRRSGSYLRILWEPQNLGSMENLISHLILPTL